MVGRYVLMIKRDDCHALGETAKRLKVIVAAEHHVASDLGGRLIRIQRQHPESDPQRCGGSRGHPGQLAAADHADAGEAGGLGHSATLPR